MTHLFLGGSLDGSTLSVHDDQDVIRWRTSTDAIYEFSGKHVEEIYVRNKIAGSATIFEVFALSSWTGDMILARLLHLAIRAERLPEEES